MVAQIADMVAVHFSADEFETLCFLVGEDSTNYPGTNLMERARLLAMKLNNEGRLAEFVSTARDIQPEVNWPNV